MPQLTIPNYLLDSFRTIITTDLPYYCFPFHCVPEKFQKKVWSSIQSPPFALSRPTSYRKTSWSHSEANRGDKISLTRNGPIFQSIPDMVRGLSHRTSFLNPSSTILHRIPTTPPGRAQLLRLVRPFPSMFGYAAAPLDGSEQYNSGGESRGVGGMSPLGSRHLDTRSSRGTGYTRSNV